MALTLGLRHVVLALVLAAGTAHAQAVSDRLREGNAAAAAGDWARVQVLVGPLVAQTIPPADLAEAHRLAGLAAYFQQHLAEADQHFHAYLQLDLDGRLDPALYPPDVVTFFENIKTKYGAELRARRPKQKRYFLLNLIPPGGQIQNGERTKAYVIGGLLGVFAVGNVTSYLVLRSWCTPVSGPDGTSVTCDDNENRVKGATRLRAINIISGVGLIATYAYGVYDGVSGYRKRSREQRVQPFVAPLGQGGIVGVGGSF